MFGSKPTYITSTLHTSNDGVTQTPTAAVRANVADLTSGFHTYGLDWTDTSITFSVDGVITGQVATPEALKATMYLLANLSVGGVLSGEADSTTPFPSQLKLDYVRVWQDAVRPTTSAPRSLLGTEGSETLAGGDANDTIDGGAGNDTLQGGPAMTFSSVAPAQIACRATSATTHSTVARAPTSSWVVQEMMSTTSMTPTM